MNSIFARLLFLSFVVTFMVPVASFAEEPVAELKEGEITAEKLLEVFKEAGIAAAINEFGDLTIDEEGLETFVKINPEINLISIFSLWPLRASVPEVDRLRMVNAMNTEIIYVKFSMPRPNVLSCDYMFHYQGGIRSKAIVDTYQRFAAQTMKAIVTNDPNGILGHD